MKGVEAKEDDSDIRLIKPSHVNFKTSIVKEGHMEVMKK